MRYFAKISSRIPVLGNVFPRDFRISCWLWLLASVICSLIKLQLYFVSKRHLQKDNSLFHHFVIFDSAACWFTTATQEVQIASCNCLIHIPHQIQPITHLWTSRLRHIFCTSFFTCARLIVGPSTNSPEWGHQYTSQSEALGSSRLPLVCRIGYRLSPASQFCRAPGG